MAKDETVSVRLDADMAQALRTLAARAGVSLSDLLRASARRVLNPFADADIQPVGYGCDHIQITGGIALTGAKHGACRMRPFYRSATS